MWPLRGGTLLSLAGEAGPSAAIIVASGKACGALLAFFHNPAHQGQIVSPAAVWPASFYYTRVVLFDESVVGAESPSPLSSLRLLLVMAAFTVLQRGYLVLVVKNKM